MRETESKCVCEGMMVQCKKVVACYREHNKRRASEGEEFDETIGLGVQP